MKRTLVILQNALLTILLVGLTIMSLLAAVNEVELVIETVKFIAVIAFPLFLVATALEIIVERKEAPSRF
jgi:hypothetical protein